MTRGEIDKALEKLIEKHGLATVRASLNNLIGNANWADWQRLSSWINNAANRIERKTT